MISTRLLIGLGLSVAVGLTAAASAGETVLLDDLAFPGRWQPDPWVKAPGTATLTGDAPDAAADGGALLVTINWPDDDEFRFFSVQPGRPRGPAPYRLKEVSLWVKAANDPHFLEVHFGDANGEDVKVGFGAMTFDGWQRLAQPIPTDWAQPLTLTSITWHNWGLKGAGGAVMTGLARLECVVDETERLVAGEDQPAVLLGTEPSHGIADDAGTCTLALRLLSWRSVSQQLVVEDELSDGDGAVLERNRSAVDFTGDQSVHLPQRLPRYGCFRCAVAVSEGGDAPVAREEVGLARLAPAPAGLTAEERMGSAIGVNTHLGAPWDAFERMGIHWARDYSWGWLGRGETAPLGQGRDFAALAADATAHGVTILPVMQGAFRNEAEAGFLEDSEAITAGFERLARAFPQLPYWEIDNEYEYHLRDRGFSVADYERALIAADEGLRRAGDAELVLNGTAGIRYDLASELLDSDARDAFAVVNSHFYTGTAPPEVGVSDANVGGDQRRIPLTAIDQLRHISRLAHAAGKESWLTEIGWDVTNGPAVGEELQALYLPRVYLLARWAGADRVFWYYDRDVPDSTTIFSTCGLIRLDGSLRPSAVAMAALSQQTARAEIAGSLDLGDDLWAMVLRQPEGDWTVAAWSVVEDHPLPKPLAEAEAADVFGNRARPERLTPAVAYFRFSRLPRAWDLQRQARWESPSVLIACPAGTVEAVVSAPAATLHWGELPAGVASTGWAGADGRYHDTLGVEPTVAEGSYPLSATAEGDGWQRIWHATLLVEPALHITMPGGYEPNQAEVCTVTSPRLSGEVTARLLGDAGTVAPASFPMQPGVRQRLAVVPSATATGILRLELSMANGARQEVALYPLRTVVPRATDELIDGEVAGWPDASRLPCVSAGGTDAPTRAHLAWAADGLRFAVQMPSAYLTPGNPDSFWDSTNVELFVDPEAGEGDWSSSCRQFWFTPVREGDGWRMAAGQWRRGADAGSVPEDRCQVSIGRADGAVVFEGLVPTEAIGRTPETGELWRCAVSVHGIGPQGSIEAAWPRTKADGLVDGPGSWGMVVFE